MRRSPATLFTGILVTAELGLLLVAEARMPLRQARESRRTRIVRNRVLLGGLAVAATAL